jgi:restriction system protein
MTAGTMTSLIEVVKLDDMDGFEFQRFIAHLYERLGYGKTQEIHETQDAGRDIIIREPNGGLIVIECKHHSKGTIGRPVVQKLHSAVINAKAKKGFVVTTGRFSQAAIKYAQGLGSLVDLVDARILYDMATRASIKLLRKGEKTSVYHILPPPQTLIEDQAIKYLTGHPKSLHSQPHNPQQLATTTVQQTSLVPAYFIEYSLHENFATTVGVIHRVHVNRNHVLIDGQTGQLLDPHLTRMINPSVMVEKWNPQNDNIISGRFSMSYSAKKWGDQPHL